MASFTMQFLQLYVCMHTKHLAMKHNRYSRSLNQSTLTQCWVSDSSAHAYSYLGSM